MSAILATSAGVRDMADGSLRITLEFEPKDAAAAYALFGVRGRAVAVAALKDGSGAIQPEPEPERKGGALAKLAGQWCADPKFQAWIGRTYAGRPDCDDELAADILRQVCGVNSRAELDHDAGAAEKFQALIRGPYMRGETC